MVTIIVSIGLLIFCDIMFGGVLFLFYDKLRWVLYYKSKRYVSDKLSRKEKKEKDFETKNIADRISGI